MKEQTVENLCKGNNIFEPPRWMTVQNCCEQFLEILEKDEYQDCGISPETVVIGVSKVGSEKQKIVSGTIKKMAEDNYLGDPLHSLVISNGKLHELEQEYIDMYKLE